MKTAILLGAGSSLPAGFPSTRCLTDRVLTGAGVERHSDSTYYLNGSSAPTEGTVRFANCVARRLHAEAERYFSVNGARPANYEDLFYLAEQALDEELGEMENPATYSYVEELRADMLPWVEAANAKNEDPEKSYCLNVPDGFNELLSETCNYISDIVWRNLCHEATSTDHLKILVEACGTKNVTGIATLCHDTHVETVLREERISLADGFSDPEARVRYWNGALFLDNKIPFLKLHGSVDWFRLRPDSSELYFDDRIGIPLDGDHQHTRTTGDDFQIALAGRPLLLIGTFNKIAQYSQGIFLELHYAFRSILQKADQLIICGYSFGDKGINSEVIEWYYAKRGRRFLVINPNPDDLVSNARGSIQHKWDEWEDSGSVVSISKPIEEVNTDEFLEAFNASGYGTCQRH